MHRSSVIRHAERGFAAFVLAVNLARNGKLGKLHTVHASINPLQVLYNWLPAEQEPAKDVVDWDLWLGPLPWRPFAGDAGHALSGMFIGDVNWSPHHYDIIQWTVNADPAGVIEVEYEMAGGKAGAAARGWSQTKGASRRRAEVPTT